jgi:hypothetical protein
MSDLVVVEYALVFDPADENDRPMMWTGSGWDSWPANDPEQGGRGPWGIPAVNSHPVRVVKRTVTYSDWGPCPDPEPPYVPDQESP